MKNKSRERYLKILNWDSWGDKFKQAMKEVGLLEK